MRQIAAILFFLSSSVLAHNGMIRIPKNKFMMGSDAKEAYPTERPPHPVEVEGFWIDVTEVTNTSFKEFVDATKYITVAERVPKWEDLKKQLPPGTPMPEKSTLVPSSLVFVPPKGKVDLESVSWWVWTPGASWKNPQGQHSNISTLMDHPVTHIAFEDAKAFCQWKNKRLPTEAEWELASRGKLENKIFAWGDEFKPQGKFMANTFQGDFPHQNLGEDKFLATAPVKSFPANGYGLFDMIGNVWEWTSDFYDEDYYQNFKDQKLLINPTGPKVSKDSADPYAIKHVIKGGSYLCANSHCINYRPSARLGASFDSGASHIGFRCVKTE